MYVPNSVLGSVPATANDLRVVGTVLVYVPNSVLGSIPVTADDLRVVGTVLVYVPNSVLGSIPYVCGSVDSMPVVFPTGLSTISISSSDKSRAAVNQTIHSQR